MDNNWQNMLPSGYENQYNNPLNSVPFLDLGGAFSPSAATQPLFHTTETDHLYSPSPSPDPIIPVSRSPPCKGKGKKKGKATQNTSETSHGRTGNYSVQEDICLCSAWVNVSKDAIVGTNQSADGYWERIHQYYHEHKTFPSTRNAKSLLNRWSTIREGVQKFCAFKALQDRLNKSGHTEADRIKDAESMWCDDMKTKTFHLKHCWLVLRECQKWKDDVHGKIADDKAASEAMPPSTKCYDTAGDTDGDRPMGRDSAKKRRSATPTMSESQYLDVLQEMVSQRKQQAVEDASEREERKEVAREKLALLREQTALQREQAALQREQTALHRDELKMKQRADERQIMSMDLNTVQGPMRYYYTMLQTQIIQEMEHQVGSQGPPPM